MLKKVSAYTGEIAVCEFHVKLHVTFSSEISHEFHVKFVSCEFHEKPSREFHVKLV